MPLAERHWPQNRRAPHARTQPASARAGLPEHHVHPAATTGRHAVAGEGVDPLPSPTRKACCCSPRRAWVSPKWFARRPKQRASAAIAAGHASSPEDVSGVPKIVGNRAVFCPPRVLLPEDDTPFCLFLDEITSVAAGRAEGVLLALLERRLGEYHLPKERGWSRPATELRTSAGSHFFQVRARESRVRTADRGRSRRVAGVGRSQRRAAGSAGIRAVRAAAASAAGSARPGAVQHAAVVGSASRDLHLAECPGDYPDEPPRAGVRPALTPHDAALFCALCDDGLGNLHPAADYFNDPSLPPKSDTAMWFVVSRMRQAVEQAVPRAG